MADELLALNGRGHGAARALGRTGDDIAHQEIIELKREVAQNLAAMQAMVNDLQAKDAQIIDLIASTVYVDSIAQGVSGNAVPTTATALSVFEFAVPDGYNWASVTVTASARATNSNAGTQYLVAYAYAETGASGSPYAWANGGAQQAAIPAGWQATVSAPLASSLAVPPAGPRLLTLKSYVSCPVGMAAAAGNYVGLDALVIYTR